jgi:hypothetical protein
MKTKFLQYSFKRDLITGTNHQLFNLFVLLAESAILERTAVVPDLKLAGKHNNGILITPPFSKYIDLSNCSESVSLISLKDFEHIKVSSSKTVLETVSTQSLKESPDDLIVREFDISVARIPFIDELVKETFYTLRALSKPAHQVSLHAEAIARSLKNFNVVHVRRTDMLNLPWWKFPGLDRGTRPRRIRRRIAQWIDDGSNLYIMSDEQQDGFFDPLRAWYKVFTYRDFPSLIKIKAEDNFLLYEIEKAIANKAQVRVEMFNHTAQYGEFKYSLFDYPRSGNRSPVYIAISKMVSLTKKILKNLSLTRKIIKKAKKQKSI